MKVKATIIGTFLVVATAILVVARGQAEHALTASVPPADEGMPPVVEISMAASPDKREWLEVAAKGFVRERSDVRLTLTIIDSMEAVQRILDEEVRPTVWSPSDTVALELFAADWRAIYHADPFALEGEDAPQPLLISPLVFVMWSDRAAALREACYGPKPWRTIRRAVVSRRGWSRVDGDPAWGFVKLGHADPARSSSGLHALILMTLEHHHKRHGLVTGDLLDPPYQAFIRGIERGVTRLSPSSTSLMTDLVRFGPSRYDIGVVPESAVIAQIENAHRRWGNLEVCYPRVTLLSEHPIALLDAAWVTDEQKAGARAWIAYLRSRPLQERALEHGFRPADPGVPLDPPEARNPFYRLAALGIRTAMPPSADAPDPSFVRNLLILWSRLAHR